MIQFLFLKDFPGLKGDVMELRRPVGWVGVLLSRKLAMAA